MHEAHGAVCWPGGQGGAILKGAQAAEQSLAVSGLKALTVEDCLELARLDLSACTDLSWLSVSGCPCLSVIILPSTGDGVEIHVDFGSAPPVLQVYGVLRNFDCCWQGGALAAPRGRQLRDVLSGVYVGPSVEMVQRSAGLAMLVQYNGPETSLRLDGPQELVVAQTQFATAIELGSGIEACEIHGLPELTRLFSSGAALLRIAACPRLRIIAGDGRTLGVTDSAVFWRLDITGCWHTATVRTSAPFGLSAPQADRLHAPRRARGSISVEVIGYFMTQVRAGDISAQDILLAWCQGAQGPKACQMALQGLEALAEGGVCLVRLWEVRCILHERNRLAGGVRRGPESAWQWDFPHDLADRGWAADLKLWLICRRAEQPVSLGALGAPRHLATILVALCQRQRADDEAHLLGLLDELWGSTVSLRATGGGFSNRSLLMRIIRYVVALRNRAFVVAVLSGLLAWLRNRKNSREHVTVLEALHLTGCDAATRSLIKLSHDSSIPLEQRRRALLAAFLPRRSDALSHLTVSDPPLGFQP